MSLVGLDLNATRALAVSGPAGAPPRPLALDPPRADLPMAISLQARRPEVGRAALALCRLTPHLACRNFFSQLGEPQKWSAGRHRLDAEQAVTLVMERLRRPCAGNEGLALAIPGYFSAPQVARLTALAEKINVPVAGSVPAPLAIALAAQTPASILPFDGGGKRGSGLAVVIDADDHALTCTAALATHDQVRLVGDRVAVRLSLRAWKERILDAVADRCVRNSRRDPRDSAASEQMLYEQLDGLLDACREGRMVDLAIEATHWYQNVVLGPEEVTGFCAPLVRQAVESFRAVVTTAEVREPVCALLLTDAAARLPGLEAALQEAAGPQATVTVLAPDAAARAAHELAAHFARGDLPRGHQETTLPLLARGQKPEYRSQYYRPNPILHSGF